MVWLHVKPLYITWWFGARKTTSCRLSVYIAGCANVLDLDLLYLAAHYEQQNVSISTPIVCTPRTASPGLRCRFTYILVGDHRQIGLRGLRFRSTRGTIF